MLKRKTSVLLVASALLMLPAAATAQSDKAGAITPTTASKGHGPVTAAALIDRYTVLAGSQANARSLVNGLRMQTEVVMVTQVTTPPKPCIPMPGRPCNGGGGGTTTEVKIVFTPCTEPMGWGNADIALALMEADLKAHNVTSVKPQHIKAALMGESWDGVTFKGILRMRADGSGWGEIAKALDFQLK